MSAPYSEDAIDVTVFTSAVDLLRQVTGGKDVVAVEVVAFTESNTSGTVVGKTKGSGATARTFGVVAGSILPSMRTIDSVTNVARVRVCF